MHASIACAFVGASARDKSVTSRGRVTVSAASFYRENSKKRSTANVRPSRAGRSSKLSLAAPSLLKA